MRNKKEINVLTKVYVFCVDTICYSAEIEPGGLYFSQTNKRD